MTITARTRKGVCKLNVEGEMTIYQADEIKRKFVSVLANSQEIELDLAKVSDLDSAGLQLLCLLKREASALGKPLRIAAHSPAVIDVIDRFNLAAYFGDPILLAARTA